MLMIPGSKGRFELVVSNYESNHRYRYTPLIFGCQDVKTAVNGEKRFLLGEARFFARCVVNYVFAWRYSGAWRFNPCRYV
jgi:hypothetical protein